MGAENSILEGCEWDDPLESSLPWTIHPVVKSDGATATVFSSQESGEEGCRFVDEKYCCEKFSLFNLLQISCKIITKLN